MPGCRWRRWLPEGLGWWCQGTKKQNLRKVSWGRDRERSLLVFTGWVGSWWITTFSCSSYWVSFTNLYAWEVSSSGLKFRILRFSSLQFFNGLFQNFGNFQGLLFKFSKVEQEIPKQALYYLQHCPRSVEGDWVYLRWQHNWNFHPYHYFKGYFWLWLVDLWFLLFSLL